MTRSLNPTSRAWAIESHHRFRGLQGTCRILRPHVETCLNQNGVYFSPKAGPHRQRYCAANYTVTLLIGCGCDLLAEVLPPGDWRGSPTNYPRPGVLPMPVPYDVVPDVAQRFMKFFT